MCAECRLCVHPGRDLYDTSAQSEPMFGEKDVQHVHKVPLVVDIIGAAAAAQVGR